MSSQPKEARYSEPPPFYDQDEPQPANEPSQWPSPIDLVELAHSEPEAPKFHIQDWMPYGYSTLLAGHGGVGKSGIALHLAVCSALGISFFGLPVQKRKVLYLSCEDRTGVLHWRLTRICAYLNIDMADLRENLSIVDLVGHDVMLWERDPRTGNTITMALGRLSEVMRSNGTEVLIVDGVSDTYGGNENSRTEVKRYVNALVSLINPHSGAVLLVGHIAKPSASGVVVSEGYSGSTGWHNSVRARWYLYPETEQGEDGRRPRKTGELLLELQKSNLGRADQQMRFRWDEDAKIFIGELMGESAFDRKHRDHDEVDGIRLAIKACMDAGEYVPAATTGPRTALKALSPTPYGLPKTLLSGRDGTRRFWRHIEELRAMKHVREGDNARTKDRHSVRTLELTEIGMRACG